MIFCRTYVKLMERHTSDIIVVNHNRTINYVGTVGKIAFDSSAKNIGGERLICVDFEKYMSGKAEYIL